jgi:hypothetical protein
MPNANWPRHTTLYAVHVTASHRPFISHRLSKIAFSSSFNHLDSRRASDP